MKYLALILFFAATSAFAEGDKVVWTSDTTYVRGGVEYYYIEGEVLKAVDKYIDDQSEGLSPLYPGDYDYYKAKEYDQNPRLLGAEPWMFRTDGVDWT